MSTTGLRKTGNFEATLAQALKDETHVEGIISPYMQNFATRAINNPEFQRMQDTLQENLAEQTKAHLEHQSFQNNVTNLAVEAKVNRSDLEYIISNLQQPTPPPAPPPQTPHDTEADRQRLIAELDGLAQKRNIQMRNEIIADMNSRDLAAQKIATPAQQIVNNYHQYVQQPQREVHHHINTPIYIPTPQVPAAERASDHMRATGLSFQQYFMHNNPTTIHVNLKNQGKVLPIEYASGSDQPSDGAREIVKSYGPVKVTPAKLTRDRYLPFENAPLPAPAPGRTISIPSKPKKEEPSQPKKEKIKIRRDEPPIPRPDYINPEFAKPPKPGPGPVPIEQVIGKKSKKDLSDSFTLMPRAKPKFPRRKVDPNYVEVVVTGKRQKEREGTIAPPPRTRPGERFPGKGQKLPDETFTPAHRLEPDTKIWLFGKKGATSRSSGGVVPFSGRGQKLDQGQFNVNALKRMKEIYDQHEAAKMAKTTLESQQKFLRRGGRMGDVVPLGKRKRAKSL